MAEDLRSILPDQRLRVGSHIKVPRSGYDHHGIYVGRYQVIHFSGKSTSLIDKSQGRIGLTSLRKFALETKIEMVEYKPLPPIFSREDIVARAEERLEKARANDDDDKYNLFFNNCEHFATCCVTGQAKSEQIRTVVLGGLAGLLFYRMVDL